MHDCGLTGEEAYILSKKYTDTHGSGGTAVQSDWEENDSTADDYIKNKPDLTAKADKVTGATIGNLAALNSSGNLTDSGHSASDFMGAFVPSIGLDVTEETDIETGVSTTYIHNSGALNVKESATDGKITLTKATSYNTSEDTDIPIHGWSNKANTSDVTISSTDTGTSITLTDSADGYVQGMTVKGHSEVVSGAIKSIGDAGWDVVDLGTLEWTYDNAKMGTYLPKTPKSQTLLCLKYECVEVTSWPYLQDYQISISPDLSTKLVRIKDPRYTDATTFKSVMSGVLLYYELADATGATPTFGITSKDGAAQGTAATITTGLPLRSTLDGTVYDELTNDSVITRCEIVSDEVVAKATPVITPLTSAEKSALASLKTYSTTHIDATDAPTMTVNYLLNTNNGKAVAQVDTRGRATSTVLYNDRNLATRAAVSVSYELAESYADFDEINLEYAYYVSGTAGAGRVYIYTFSFDAAELEEIRTKQFDGRTGRIMLAALGGYISLYITDTTHLLAEEVNNASGSHYQYITQITGIKHL